MIIRSLDGVMFNNMLGIIYSKKLRAVAWVGLAISLAGLVYMVLGVIDVVSERHGDIGVLFVAIGAIYILLAEVRASHDALRESRKGT